MNNNVAAINASENLHDLWHVQVDVGDVRWMTLDDLDAAYQRDCIGEETLVRREGGARWATLGEVAGIAAPGGTATDTAGAVAAAPPRAWALRIFFGMAASIVVLAGVAHALSATTLGAADRPDAAVVSASPVAVTSPAQAPAPTSAGTSPPAVSKAIPQAPATIVAAAKASRVAKVEPKAKDRDQAREAPRKLRRYAKQTSNYIGMSAFHEGGNEHDPLNSKL